MLNDEVKKIMMEQSEGFQQKVQELLAHFNNDAEFPNDKFRAVCGGGSNSTDGFYINAFTTHTEPSARERIGGASAANTPTKPMTLADKIKALRGTGGGVSAYTRRPNS